MGLDGEALDRASGQDGEADGLCEGRHLWSKPDCDVVASRSCKMG